jgi:flagellar export protein FliJ
MTAEQKVAAGSVEAGIAYGQYAKGVIARRATLGQSLVEVEGQIRLALDDVAEAFRELKKFDIVKARRDREMAERTKRLQQSQLDEMGLQLHRRSNEQKK